MNTNSRSEILKRIKAVENRRPLVIAEMNYSDAETLKPILPDPITCFKEELEAINGQCILCDNEEDLYSKIKNYLSEKKISQVYTKENYIAHQLAKRDIQHSTLDTDFEEMSAAITGCEFLIARTGSVVVSAAAEGGRKLHVFPPIHLVIAHQSQIVDYPTDALIAIHKKYDNALPSVISTITGPSRTADIEKTLVLGAHGPKEFIVFLA